MKEFSSERALRFTESVIRDMTRVCIKHKGVNLAQGFPDFAGARGDQGSGHQGHPGRI